MGFHYDVANGGYTIITKKFDPELLFGTKGIRFFYRGKDKEGGPNTIEFKLILKYPSDTQDTIYGILWNGASDTDDQWKQVDVLYRDLFCWLPAENCKRHGDQPDLTAVDRLDFVVSNKPGAGDPPGSGDVALDDVQAIPACSP